MQFAGEESSETVGASTNRLYEGSILSRVVDDGDGIATTTTTTDVGLGLLPLDDGLGGAKDV